MNLGDALEASGVSQGDLIGLNGEHVGTGTFGSFGFAKKSRSGDQKK